MTSIAKLPPRKTYHSDKVENLFKFNLEITQGQARFNSWMVGVIPPLYLATGAYTAYSWNNDSLTSVFFAALGTAVAYKAESHFAYDRHVSLNKIKIYEQYLKEEKITPGQQHIPDNFNETVKQSAKAQAKIDLRKDWKHWVYKGAIVTVGALTCGYQLYQGLPQNTKDSFNRNVFGSAEIQQPVTQNTRSVPEAYGLLRLRSQ